MNPLKTLIKNIKYLASNNLKEEFQENQNKNFVNLITLFENVLDLKIFICPRFGLGESTCLAGLFHELKKKYNNKKILLLITSTSRKNLFSLYEDIDYICEISQETYNYLFEKQATNYTIFQTPYSLVKNKHNSIISLIKEYLELPSDAKIKRAKISTEAYKQAENLFTKLKLKKGKTFFCVPKAICLGDKIVEDNFWGEFEHTAKTRGYDVVFNSEIDLDLTILLPFVELCGNVAGVRTGLLDFIAANTQNIKIHTIYPNKNNYIWKETPEIIDNLRKSFVYNEDKDFLENYISSASLITNFDNNSCIEYISTSTKEITEKILQQQ